MPSGSWTACVLSAAVAAGIALGSALARADEQPRTADPETAPVQGCDAMPTTKSKLRERSEELITQYGGAAFANPAEIVSRDGGLRYYLVVEYAKNMVAGCTVTLRSYNGKLVGDTLRVKPGDVLRITLINNLPFDSEHHPQPPPPEHGSSFSFNITNLHTHGLHVSPEKNGDNVFIEVHPQQSQEYEIKIPENHPAGTFWYHAHLHGSTAIQVSSGMAGALIVEGGADAHGGLDSLAEIKAAKERIFVLQQFSFDETGRLEQFGKVFPGGTQAKTWRRLTTVNGQLVPTIKMRPGEVQRWRFIHAGVQENIRLVLDEHPLHEIAADGIALGRIVPWRTELLMAPGYRTDVLVQAQLRPGETSSEYFVRSEPIPATMSLGRAGKFLDLQRQPGTDTRLQGRSELIETSPELSSELEEPQAIIAKVIVEGPATEEMKLPSAADLATRVPTELREDITDDQLTGEAKTVKFSNAERICSADGDCSATCISGEPNCICDPDGGCSRQCNLSEPGCKSRMMVNNRVFVPDAEPFLLQLGKPSEWTLSVATDPHVFHIHVNPFQMARMEPDGTSNGGTVSRKVWKDTVLIRPTDGRIPIRSRYTDFPGKFVLHCHILAHEDSGMMSTVVVKEPQP